MRIEPVSNDDPAHDELFSRARRTYRWLPNTIRVMARGSRVAELYMDAGRHNRASTLDALERELIAIVTAAHNGCEYCLSAHMLAARALGASQPAVRAARTADADDPRHAAMLRFAGAVLDTSGRVSNEQLADARAAGIEDTLLLDIVAVVIENCLGNFVNNIAQTELDDVLVRGVRRAVPASSFAPR